MQYLLDTNVLSELVRPQPHPSVLERFQMHADACALSSVVWHELNYGVQRLAPGRQRDTLAHYLQDVVQPSFPVIPYDETAAQWHALERARLERLGRSRPFADGMIAATAATRRLIFVSRNTKDFEDFDELLIENWFETRAEL